MKGRRQTVKVFNVLMLLIVVFVVIGISVTFIGGGRQVPSRERAILNNLRQIASAADSYFIENGVLELSTLYDLVGTDKFIPCLEPISGENYELLFPIKAGFTELTVKTSNNDPVTLRFDPEYR